MVLCRLSLSEVLRSSEMNPNYIQSMYTGSQHEVHKREKSSLLILRRKVNLYKKILLVKKMGLSYGNQRSDVQLVDKLRCYTTLALGKIGIIIGNVFEAAIKYIK